MESSGELWAAINTALLLIWKIWDKVEKKNIEKQLRNANMKMEKQLRNVNMKMEIAAEAAIKTAEVVTPNDKFHEDYIEHMRTRLFSLLGNADDYRQKETKGENKGLYNG